MKKNKHTFNRLLIGLTAALLLATTGAHATQTTRVSVSSTGAQGNRDSGGFADGISADGRYVAFQSFANNLVAGDTNGAEDVFVRDRVTGTTMRVNVSSEGKQTHAFSSDLYPTISADGRYVAFSSDANDLVAGDKNGTTDGFVRDRVTGKTTRVSVSSEGKQGNDYSYISAISADGRYVAFSSNANDLVTGDTNGIDDVFVRDRVTGKTTRVSVS
jgi:Tol biopolymer transport system component